MIPETPELFKEYYKKIMPETPASQLIEANLKAGEPLSRPLNTALAEETIFVLAKFIQAQGYEVGGLGSERQIGKIANAYRLAGLSTLSHPGFLRVEQEIAAPAAEFLHQTFSTPKNPGLFKEFFKEIVAKTPASKLAEGRHKAGKCVSNRLEIALAEEKIMVLEQFIKAQGYGVMKLTTSRQRNKIVEAYLKAGMIAGHASGHLRIDRELQSPALKFLNAAFLKKDIAL